MFVPVSVLLVDGGCTAGGKTTLVVDEGALVFVSTLLFVTAEIPEDDARFVGSCF